MELRLIEAASEIGAGTRGTSMGMAALRVAAWKLGSELFGHAEESVLRDENDVLYEDERVLWWPRPVAYEGGGWKEGDELGPFGARAG